MKIVIDTDKGQQVVIAPVKDIRRRMAREQARLIALGSHVYAGDIRARGGRVVAECGGAWKPEGGQQWLPIGYMITAGDSVVSHHHGAYSDRSPSIWIRRGAYPRTSADRRAVRQRRLQVD